MVMTKINNLLDEIKDIIVFEISGTEYCTFIKDITAIINPATRLTDINNKSEITSIHFEGSEIPVFNLSKILNNNSEPITNHSRIFVIEMDGQKYGFITNKIKEIISIDKNYSNINLNFKKHNENKTYCSGILDFEGSKYKILDCNKLIEYFSDKI